ncbi:MBL fold metallo-hydrolase [Leptospira semungkisensis]|uniref:MBL fold metallo-hydrolase n=1 Tax=Leptospira semungkisensis TaxID=2484985 RepID=A0A4R9FS82_9LEPT|nr:MBL fold metallo-hydrolase [Leptospira semungkisensis]TGK01648.1 MBL fold metallo-hydrolase [Leptospira semungkisensis]
MATLSKRRPENQVGPFYVDSSCIDCETCRILAPQVFGEDRIGSFVQKQPESELETFQALQALVSCPTASIGTEDRLDLQEAKASFPRKIADSVYHCGFHSKSSFGAFSYLIVREEGNILIDSPRYIPSLAEKIKSLGGIRYHFLTHRDDIADHEKFHQEFGTQRIIHEGDLSSLPEAEIVIHGNDPYSLAKDLVILPGPGHTKGHSTLLYKNEFLFTGDHLAFDPKKERLIAFRNACWYSWEKQTESMRLLEKYDFEWVLPGHGHPTHADREKMKEMLRSCISWMESR